MGRLSATTGSIVVVAGPLAVTVAGPELGGLTLPELADVAEHARLVSDRWLTGRGWPAVTTVTTSA